MAPKAAGTAREGLTRREVLGKAAGIGLAAVAMQLGLGPKVGGIFTVEKAKAQGKDLVRWISPRGTLEVMDDYNLWVPIKLGYFDELGIEVQMEPGPLEATAVTKFVASGQSDVGYPSPGVFTSSIEAGMDLISAWQQLGVASFDFALPIDSPIEHPSQLAGKTIALGSEGWSVIVDPMLVEVGVDPKSVRYVNAGAQWGAVVAQGQADAGLAWAGLRAQWGALGLQMKYLLGYTWTRFPGNVYEIRRSDFEDPEKREVLERFFVGSAMGHEFALANPRAAAQITYEEFPGLRAQMNAQVATESMRQNAYLYAASLRRGHAWGWHDFEGWQSYLTIIRDLGQIRTDMRPEEILTNHFSDAAARGLDKERVRRDAEAFELSAEFQQVTMEGPMV